MNMDCMSVYDACSICASSGRPAMKNKLSLSYVNEAFNKELQFEFRSFFIGNDKFEILSMVGVGMSYEEGTIILSRSASSMMMLIETI